MEIEEAVSILKNALKPIEETEFCQISEAYGRIAACDIFAPINVPPFAKSAMDGYAVRAADLEGASAETPVILNVTGQLFAGDWQKKAHEEGAIRVMTGSPVPNGFDAVVMQEDTDYGEKKVRIYKSVRVGQNYCALGEDIKKDSLVLKAGTKIGRAHIGLLASLGIAEIEVRRKVKVSIITTGSELLEAGKTLASGKIYSSIAPMLSCAVQSAGQTVTVNQIVKDDEKEIFSAIKIAARKADIIITTGGVSVGKKDYLPEVLNSLAAQKLFSHVNIQPGTPTLASLLTGKLLLSLSGNPYAALVNFDIYFYHAISLLTGCKELSTQKKIAILNTPYEKINKLRRFVRAYFENGFVNLPVENHASSVISNLTECNCYIDLPAGKAFKKGDKVTVWMIKD
ncbi:gephyrin-like molybdotransferase Glp [Treponema sp. C6A8]|uniref:molybdopterin molybdotransferase MoeA n=1 Tax=Treponema sp. C6A8 TaxID=1410609 RepID=UPI00056EABAE|nr:gephyrin-like molybdotransferase Glp [Treponema sp. C6A8]